MAERQKYTPNIIVVTVDPEICDILEVLLKNLNYKIQLTNSSAGAFEKLKEKDYDLMLLDISLPGMNIVQVLNYVKDISPDTSVIVLTGYASNDDVTECLNNGAYDFFKKPFEKEEIMRRIKNALSQKRLKKELQISREKLSALEKRYEYMVQNSPDFIYTLDDQGNFTYINESSKNMLGYEKDQLLRKHYSSVVYHEDIEKAKYVFNERRAGNRESKVTKLRLKKNSGATRSGSSKFIVVELKAKGIYDKPIKEKDKVFLGTQGIAKDISTSLQIEESLKIQKVCFRQLFNNSHEAIVILDTQDNIIDANRSFEKLFNYSSIELKNKNINNLIVPENLYNESRSISSSAVSTGYVEKESTRICKNGTPVDVSIFAYPVIYNHKTIAVYHIYKESLQESVTGLETERTLNKLRKAMGGIIDAMVSTVEVRDPYTAGHQQRVADLARAIAQEMGMTEEEIDGIRMAGTLHDLGKVNIPAEILSKPGRLSDIEFSLIKMHPRVAFDILKEIDFPWPIADMVYQHHERLDGSGYPQGLKGDEILLSGKILTVADVVESIASHRPYRPALGIKTALNEINVKRGIYYEPSVVDACIKLFEQNRFQFSDETKHRATVNLML
ncbi:MAG: PAS domain S-box protein [Spirochaetes bacterium]|nr:PAS domain S-box protein [Spirochaetota bacterium]